MPERDELDRLIDSELARYAEPRAGLEQRILARVEADAVRRPGIPGRWQRWVLAGAMATMAIAAVFVSTSRQSTPNETSATTARTMRPRPAPITTAKEPVPEIHVQVRPLPRVAKMQHSGIRIPVQTAGANRSRYPKLDVFPAPQPLSEEEQALVAIATTPAATARENLMASQSQVGAPLQIAAIDIQPIATPSDGRK